MSQQLPHVFPGGTVIPALPVSEQHRYPSVFRASEERTQININVWWEDQAGSIFFFYDTSMLERLLRYPIYDDPRLPTVLSTRSVSDIDCFLSRFLYPQELASIAAYSPGQKAQILIDKCKPIVPPTLSWNWFPARKHRDLEPQVIAEAIEAESHLHFTRITYPELVRYALGKSSARIDWFLLQHTRLYAYLLNHLRAYPEEVMKYSQIEQHLRGLSPFAHRAVAQALRDAGHQIILPNPQPGFDFFVVPIQRLFKELPRSLPYILTVLALLEVRFQQRYLHAGEMSWSQPFSVAHSFLEDFQTATSTSTSIKYFASILTESDERDFAALIEGDTLDERAASRLSARWENLSFEVWEFCKALPDQIDTILRLLENLLASRNYHTLMAILSGLQRYSVSGAPLITTDDGGTMLVPNPLVTGVEYLELLDPSQNYAVYRGRFQDAPGIPFLIPHLREQEEHGDSVFQQLYTQLREVIPLR
ncbi:uncharacterized protein BDV14DRAFT_195587 [Aspergillus stella-maris]|uniref:uncharacterized protein n=1 Tax=Aspergillus stella-maris TaxID=1810926 RepID=UPI003CCE369A